MAIGIPDNEPTPTYKRRVPPGAKVTPPSGFNSPDRIASLKAKARTAALKAKVMQARNGTAHEQHVAHEQHMANVKNNPNKYGKQINY